MGRLESPRGNSRAPAGQKAAGDRLPSSGSHTLLRVGTRGSLHLCIELRPSSHLLSHRAISPPHHLTVTTQALGKLPKKSRAKGSESVTSRPMLAPNNPNPKEKRRRESSLRSPATGPPDLGDAAPDTGTLVLAPGDSGKTSLWAVWASVPARGRWNIDFASLTSCAGRDVSSSECTLPWERPGRTPSVLPSVSPLSQTVPAARSAGPHRSPACIPGKLRSFSSKNLGCKPTWKQGSLSLDPLEPTTGGAHCRGPRARPGLGEKVRARGTPGGIEPSIPALEPRGRTLDSSSGRRAPLAGLCAHAPGAPRLRPLPAPRHRLRHAIG